MMDFLQRACLSQAEAQAPALEESHPRGHAQGLTPGQGPALEGAYPGGHTQGRTPDHGPDPEGVHHRQRPGSAVAQGQAQAPPDAPRVSRRALVAGAGALGGAALCAGPAPVLADARPAALGRGPRMDSEFLLFEDPAARQRASWRILRTLVDDADVLFWYHFTMFTVPEGRRPEPVVRWEGIEFSHHRQVRDGIFRVHGHNLSFPRDLATGRFVDSAVNPVTGATVPVPPMALTEDPGYIYTPDGVVPLDDPQAPPRARYEQFLVEDDLVKIEQVRLAPASWPATFIETSSNWASRTLFERGDAPSLPAGTAGGYIFPWPAWLAMGERPGHMFATWHGRKLDDVTQLPAAFVERAERDHANLLAVDLGVFDRPLPAPLAQRYG